jgi:hypothetical protein
VPTVVADCIAMHGMSVLSLNRLCFVIDANMRHSMHCEQCIAAVLLVRCHARVITLAGYPDGSRESNTRSRDIINISPLPCPSQ